MQFCSYDGMTSIFICRTPLIAVFKTVVGGDTPHGVFNYIHNNYNDFLKPNLRLTEVYKRKLKKINNLPKIGISWISARIDLGKDKSIKLEQLLPILKKKNLSFVNLQYGDHAKTINANQLSLKFQILFHI